MSISEIDRGRLDSLTHGPASAVPVKGIRSLHRIATVRRQQNVTLRRAAQQLRLSMEEARAEENESSDLPLSRLYAWQQVLEVPLVDLLLDTESPLSAPVMERARLVRLMKTAAAIHEKAPNVSIKRLTEMLINQLVEVMPELSGVTPWHSVGQRRSLEEFGKTFERIVPARIFREN